jgi:uncharacterized protein YndB with AHSA1/START domain
MAGRSLQLVMTRVFEAPRDLVFRAWIDPQLEKRWSSPLGVTVPVCETDPRPGGAWRLCMRTPVGEELWAAGVYRQVLAPERLVTTHAWENPDGTPGHQTVITVTLAERGRRTEMTFRQAGFDSAEAREGHGEGWAECFDKLEWVLARGGQESP